MAEHQITMKDDKPIKQRYYPKNPKVQGDINAKVDELLQMGYIEHSTSPYISPVVMLKKKSGQWRLCVDFRQINAKSIKEHVGPKGWVLANPTERRQQPSHDAYSAGERLIPVESNAIRTSFGVCDLSTGRPRNVAARICLPG